MPSAITPLANITLSSSATTVTFSSISQAYRDLVLVINAKDTSSAGNYVVRVNGDTGANYSRVNMEGNGTSVSSASGTTSYLAVGWNYTEYGTNWSNLIMNFMDYSVTDKHKTVLARANDSSQAVVASANRWANTSAITSMSIGANIFAAGSTFALYGVSA